MNKVFNKAFSLQYFGIEIYTYLHKRIYENNKILKVVHFSPG